MRQNDETVLETIGKLRDVVEMNVAVAGGPLLMAIRNERAFDDQHLRFEKSGVRFEDAAIGVAGVEKQRMPVFLGHLSPLPPKFRDVVGAGEPRPQTVTNLERLARA